MRYALKAASLQNPVLTNRNGIGGRFIRVSNHGLATPKTNKAKQVDAAVIGGRKKLLPGEVSPSDVVGEKSAEVIVVAGTSRTGEENPEW